MLAVILLGTLISTILLLSFYKTATTSGDEENNDDDKEKKEVEENVVVKHDQCLLDLTKWEILNQHALIRDDEVSPTELQRLTANRSLGVPFVLLPWSVQRRFLEVLGVCPALTACPLLQSFRRHEKPLGAFRTVAFRAGFSTRTIAFVNGYKLDRSTMALLWRRKVCCSWLQVHMWHNVVDGLMFEALECMHHCYRTVFLNIYGSKRSLWVFGRVFHPKLRYFYAVLSVPRDDPLAMMRFILGKMGNIQEFSIFFRKFRDDPHPFRREMEKLLGRLLVVSVQEDVGTRFYTPGAMSFKQQERNVEYYKKY